MAAVDLLSYILVDLQLAISVVRNKALGGGCNPIPVQLLSGMWEQEICHKKREGLFRRVETKPQTCCTRKKAGMDR